MKLQGLNFVNTRPLFANKHQALTQELQALGVDVIPLPLQEIVATAPKTWLAVMDKLPSYQAIIFVSSPAALFFGQQLRHAWPKQVKAIAIGSATAKTLRQFKISPITVAEEANSESLLTLKELQASNCQKILLVKGPHGRALIGNCLSQLGKTVDSIDVYQSKDIDYPSQALRCLWLEPQPHIILISSLKALIHLWQLIPETKQIAFQQISLLVFSERIAQEARSFLKNPIFITKHDTIIPSLIAFHQSHANQGISDDYPQ